MKAWIHQDSKQVKKRGKDRASWYVSWLDGTGRHMRSCGPGRSGRQLAEKLKIHITTQLVIGGYKLGGSVVAIPEGILDAEPQLPKKQPFKNNPKLTAKADGEAVVYFLEAVGVDKIKIGASSHVQKRIRSIQKTSPVQLRLLAIMKGGGPVEEKLHAQFAHLRSHGEWFHAATELRDFVKRIEAECRGE